MLTLTSRARAAGTRSATTGCATSRAGYDHLGIPTYVDGHKERLPTNFPLGEDTILYFGWYTNNIEGPFKNPDWKFKRGAVACHIHSYSAATLRSNVRGWTAPLLAKGAAASFGNVFEPFLTYTTHLDEFNRRLLEGYTFIEAAWMATPSVSWMNTMVGDPLYQPFLPNRNYAKQPDADFKAVRLGVSRWRDEPELFEKLELAANKLASPKIYEAVGLRYREALKFDEADARVRKSGKGLRIEAGQAAHGALPHWPAAFEWQKEGSGRRAAQAVAELPGHPGVEGDRRADQPDRPAASTSAAG